MTSELAFYDCFAGMLPVTRLSVEPRDGTRQPRATIKVNVTSGGYRRGEILTVCADDVILRRCYRKKRGSFGRYYVLPEW